ncbi:MAG: RagB/SusD family nutrient uptake outer membrane protein [Rikenellaceae bacterium]
MKQIKNKIVAGFTAFAALFGLSSCEDYLDMAPSMGVDESVVYVNYESVSSFLDGTYRWLGNEFDYGSLGNQYSWNGGMSDECASIYNSYGLGTINSGNWSALNISGYELGDNGTASLSTDSGTIIFRSYRTIRIANAVLDNYTRATMSEDEINKILGQAYFMRAWGYFQLMRRYGGMPDLTKLYAEISDYDQPRLTYHESNDLLIADLDRALELLPDQWDENNIGRVNKSAAYGLKSMALTYDASPLMQNGLDETVDQDYSKERALIAAQFTQTAIDYINSGKGPNRLSGLENSVIKDYANIAHWGADHVIADDTYTYQPEEGLFYNRDLSHAYSSSLIIYLIARRWANTGTTGGNWVNSYYAPSQNMVDMYERKGDDGNYYPITSSESGYVSQSSGAVVDMYVDRDPRFYNNILCPGQTRDHHKLTSVPIPNDYYSYYDTTGSLVEGEMRTDRTNTYIVNREQSGYVENKFAWNGRSAHGADLTGTTAYTLQRVITVYIRVSQLYLDYAETAYEATGSYDTVPTGCSMTAKQALDIIRTRGGITEWKLSSGDTFRDAYRRERCVELMFEHHRWFDIRRWMIAEELFAAQYPIKGVYAIRNNYNPTLYPETVSRYATDGVTVIPGNLDGFASPDPTSDNYNVEYDVTKSATAITCTPVVLTPENRVFTKKNYWYPFSTYDVNAMKNLKQNPGW